MSYNAGQAVLQVVPSYSGVADAIDAEVAKWGESAGTVFGKSFEDAAKKSIGDPIPDEAPQSEEKGSKAGGAFADAFRARVDAALKSLPDADIGLNATEFDQELADVRLELETLRGQKIGIDISDAEALAKIAEIKLALEEIGASSESAQIKLDTSVATAELEKFTAAAGGGPGGAGGALKGLEGDAAGASSSFSALGLAAVSLGPSLLPIAANLVVGFGALVPMLTAATGGIGAFALAAASDLGPVKSALEQTVSDFQKLEQSTVQPVIDNGLGLLIPIFSQLSPLVSATSGELVKLEDAGRNALQSPFWRGFSTFISSEAGPAIDSFATLVGGLLKLFAGASIALGPEIADIEGGIAGFSARIASFGQNLANNPGFQHFIDYVHTEAPVVGNALSNIGGILEKLAIGLAPIGAASLSALDGLSKLVKLFLDLGQPVDTAVVAIAGLAFAYAKLRGPLQSAVSGITAFFNVLTAENGAAAMAALSTDAEKAGGGFASLVTSLTGGGGLLGALAGLGVVAGGVALAGLGIWIGGLIGANDSTTQLDAAIRNLEGGVRDLPTKTLPQMTSALHDAETQLNKVTDAAGLTRTNFDKLRETQPIPADHIVPGEKVVSLATASGNAIANLTTFIAGLKSQVTVTNDNIGSLQQKFDITRQSAISLAESIGLNLNKALTPAQVMQFSAALQQQATQTGLTQDALEHLATAAHTTTSQFSSDVQTAVSKATKAWAAYGDAVTAFSSSTLPPTADQIGQFYALEELQAGQFATNIQAAIKAGYSPTLISQILQAGPAQASQLLQGLVNAQGTGLQNLINQATAAMSKEGQQAVEEARVTQIAVSSKSAAVAAELSSALSLDQALLTSNTLASVENVINGMAGGYPAFLQVVKNYGLALPTGLQLQLDNAYGGGSAQGNSATSGLNSTSGSMGLTALALAALMPGAFNGIAGPGGPAYNSGAAVGNAVAQGALDAIANLASELSSALNNAIHVGGGVVTPPTPPGLGPGRMAGGPVEPGTIYPVGEAGVELFAPDVPGTIIPNSLTTMLMPNVSGNIVPRSALVTPNSGPRSGGPTGPVVAMSDVHFHNEADIDGLMRQASFRRRGRIL